MANQEVREAVSKSKIRFWQVAAEMGVSETTLCRWLRMELPERKKKLVLQAVKNVQAKRELYDEE